LLFAACPDQTVDKLVRLGIGRRDALLLELRALTFGPKLSCAVACPSCRERLEVSFNVADLRAKPEVEFAQEYSLSCEEYDVKFRLPNHQDLLAVMERDGAQTTRDSLFERCVISARHNREAKSASQLPAAVVEEVMEKMAQADPMGNIQLVLHCPACEHRWQTTFDIVSFFWAEIGACVHRLLREVHLLASVYGWRETDILSLSPWRRQLYLRMVTG